MQQIVQSHGKQMVGWDEIAAVTLLPSSIVQHWRPHTDMDRLAGVQHLILSPGDRAYLDMKYDAQTALGLDWAGLIPVTQAYDWDPAAIVPGLPPSRILGIEAPLWSETLGEMRDVEFLAFPRIAAIADVAWVAAVDPRLEAVPRAPGAQAPRWTALGINFYRAPEIPWPVINDDPNAESGAWQNRSRSAFGIRRTFGIRHSALTRSAFGMGLQMTRSSRLHADLGRQPFGLASPAAWLRADGHDVTCVDLTRTASGRHLRAPRVGHCLLPADAHGDAPGAAGHRSRSRQPIPAHV